MMLKDLVDFLSPLLISSWQNGSWMITHANTPMQELLGLPEERLIGRNEIELVPADYRKELVLRNRLLLAEKFLSTKARLLDAKGKIVHVGLESRLIQQAQALYCVTSYFNINHYRWFGEQYAAGTVISCGLISSHYVVTHVQEKGNPSSNAGSNYEFTSIFDYVDESAQASIKKKLEQCKKNGDPLEEDFFLETHESEQLVVRSLVKPFYNGYGRFVFFGFVVKQFKKQDSSLVLKKVMLDNNINASQLSRLTNISMTTISKLRNGKVTRPHRLTAELIASELGVKAEDIWEEFSS